MPWEAIELYKTRDGRITIAGKQYAFDPSLAHAFRKHPTRYLMGTIGPDTFSNPVTRQSSGHPGVPGGWHTDDFLEHLIHSARTGDELAFTYGYISHAVGYFFQTYVNPYACDTFSMTNGEQEFELHHFLAEKLIDQHTCDPSPESGRFGALPAFDTPDVDF